MSELDTSLGFRILLLFLVLALGNFLSVGMITDTSVETAFERTFFQGVAFLTLYLSTFFVSLDNG